jgi:hypothetical protein
MLAFYKASTKQKTQYYYIHDYQASLFSPHCLTIIWGKDLQQGRKKEFIFETRAEMDRKIREIVKKRVLENYKLLYSYPQKNDFKKLFDSYSRQNKTHHQQRAV